MPVYRRALLTLAAAAWVPGGASAGQAPPEPDTYRMDRFNAPTPLTLRGATVMTTPEAAELWRQKQAVFVDVLPRAPRPAGLAPGTIWQEPPRFDIPGSVWLPDTGYGALAPEMEDYFRRELAQATAGDKSKWLVFYCKPDCWMSWNAAKRALALGYTHVGWYPGGVAAWQQAGLPLEQREPRPRPQ